MYNSDLLARNMHKLIRTKQKIVGELTYAGESTVAPRGGQIRKLSTATCHDRENGRQIHKLMWIINWLKLKKNIPTELLHGKCTWIIQITWMDFGYNLSWRMTHTFLPVTVIVVGNFVKNGCVYHLNVQSVVLYLHWINRMNPCSMNWRLIVQIK